MEKIQTLHKYSDAIRILMPLVDTPKNHTPYEKTVSGLSLTPVKDPLWRMDREALTQTMRYLFSLSHQCYVLSVVDGKPSMFKIMPELHESYQKRFDQALKGLTNNPHITDKQRAMMEKLKPLRIMQCVVKDRVNVDLDQNEYLTLFRTLSLPDGLFILNLTDAVIVRKDKKHPFPMVMGDVPAPTYTSLLPILTMSGQKGYMDIPIPNYDEMEHVYTKPPAYDTWTTEWTKKTDPRAVFRGGPTGCGYTDETNMRIKLALLAKEDLFKDRLDIGLTTKNPKQPTIDSGSVRFDPVHGLGMLNTGIKPGSFLSMEQQSHYRYILHVDGNVNAYRLLNTLATGSLVLRVISDYTSWAEQYLQAGVHYLAVERDLSNLDTLLTYCEKNQDKCKEIAENGRVLARKILTREFLENYFLMTFNQFRLSREEYETLRPKVTLLSLPEETRVSAVRLAMIVPHRNQLEQLEKLRALQSYDTGKHLVDIYVVDQNNADDLKRALLWNVGYQLAKEKRYDRYVFHATDALPDELLFKQYFKHSDKAIVYGPGVIGLTGEQFEQINGFPNTFTVGEEEALVNRLARQNIPLYKPDDGTLLRGVVNEVSRWDDMAEDSKRSAMNGLEQLSGLTVYVRPYELDDFLRTYQTDQKKPEPDRVLLKDAKNERSLDDAFAVYPYKVSYVVDRNQIAPLRKVKVVEPEPVEPLPVLKETIKDDHLYVSNLVTETVSVKFEHCGRDMEKYFLLYARDHLEGRCIKEGYVRPDTTKVITYTSGGIHGTLIEYRVLYLVHVCHPYEGMRLTCQVESVSKIGIRAVIRKGANPIVVYLTRELNPGIYMEDYELEQVIEVSVLGHRFERQDPFISVLGTLV